MSSAKGPCHEGKGMDTSPAVLKPDICISISYIIKNVKTQISERAIPPHHADGWLTEAGFEILSSPAQQLTGAVTSEAVFPRRSLDHLSFLLLFLTCVR